MRFNRFRSTSEREAGLMNGAMDEKGSLDGGGAANGWGTRQTSGFCHIVRCGAIFSASNSHKSRTFSLPSPSTTNFVTPGSILPLDKRLQYGSLLIIERLRITIAC